MRAALLALSLLATTGCGSSPPEPSSPKPSSADPSPARSARQVQRGKATWYGGKFQGRKTASGERFDKHKLTAAHRKLPFGTRVRVTNMSNGRSVVVRINDRGPFGGKGRIIDVSKAAARKLKMIRAGVVEVEVEVLP
ncbi:MAG: septal ring lytic transglycosylase RlpA family protein [Deltaproteobacteria bacterium]|nr:septal ring lytic transglycosylase RlpA family protein [Deltaproteobacteria bacterium]